MPRKKKFSVPAASEKTTSRTTQQQEVYAEASSPLVALENIDLEQADLAELGQVVQDATKACGEALLNALHAAIIAGQALTKAKDKYLNDRTVGGFKGWVEEQGLSQSAAYRYMELANYSDLVFNASTLTEAYKLISQYKSENNQQPTKTNQDVHTIRATLKLPELRYLKLEAIAKQKGKDSTELISEVLDKWIARQKVDETIDVEHENT